MMGDKKWTCIDCWGERPVEPDWRDYKNVCPRCLEARSKLDLLVPASGCVRLEIDPSAPSRVRMFSINVEVFPVPRSLSIEKDGVPHMFAISLTNFSEVLGIGSVFQITNGKGSFVNGNTIDELRAGALAMLRSYVPS